MVDPEAERRLKTFHVTVEETVRVTYEVQAVSNDDAEEIYLEHGASFETEVLERNLVDVVLA